MERVEASRVLGLEEGATVEAVRRAYRRLATGYEQMRLAAATPEMEREVEERLRLLLAAVLPAGLPAWDDVGWEAGLVEVVRARPPAGERAGQVWESRAGIRLVWIPAGAFRMGSNNGEDDEQPVHRVRLTQGGWLGETEVTSGSGRR